MNELTHLTFLRKHNLELTKLFFYEIQKGKHLSEFADLKQQIDDTIAEIKRLEKELSIRDTTDDST